MLERLSLPLDTATPLQWKANLRVEVVDDASIVAINGEECDLLVGRLLPLIAPHIEARRSTLEMYDALASELSPPEISYSLEYLYRRGLITESSDAEPSEAAFWHLQDTTPEAVAARLASVRVRLIGAESPALAMLLEALRDVGIQLAEGDEAEALTLFVTNDYLDPALEEQNAAALENGTPWIVLCLDGRESRIGPYFRPGESGCWACLEQRLRSNRQIERFFERSGIVRPAGFAQVAHPAPRRVAAAMAAQEVLKVLTLHEDKHLADTILALDAASLEISRHQLTRRPQCPACGEGRLPEKIADHFVLTEQAAQGFEVNGSRVMTPEKTLERLSRHVSHLTGVVRSLNPIGEGKSNGLTHSYQSGHNFALMQHDLRFALLNLRGRSGGKGSTDLEAKVGAICEAIERYSGVYRGDEPVIRSSMKALVVPHLHPNRLMNFSVAQYANREEWNQVHLSGFHKVPLVFDVEREVAWAPAFSLKTQSFVYVPAAYCYFGHPDLHEHFFCSCDSNGNAAGNTKEEAILQGLLELVERDATALWWYNMRRLPVVDPASMEDDYVKDVLKYYASRKREVWFLDVTSDLGVPVIAAVSRATDRSSEDILLGFGAHPDVRVAVRRALTELNQFYPAVSRSDGKGGTAYWFPEKEAIDWWRNAKIETQEYLKPLEGKATKRVSDMPQTDARNVYAALNLVLGKVHAAGLDVLVLDQTQPEIDLCVVKVMVPGLRHFWKRYGPGRLYDVPAAQGWQKEKTNEDRLNPYGVFF